MTDKETSGLCNSWLHLDQVVHFGRGTHYCEDDDEDDDNDKGW